MAKKKKPDVTIFSHGQYADWDRDSRELPRLVKITTEIKAELDIEFGYILRIRNARNSKITFCIDHPPFPDATGVPAKAFTGELYVKTNDFRFFLGDTVWPPVSDKRGDWTLTTWIDGIQVACKTLTLI